MKKGISQWQSRIKKILGKQKHHEAAKKLGVGIDTFRSWIYAKHQPSEFTKKLLIEKMKELNAASCNGTSKK